MQRAVADGEGDQCTSGLNFATARPRRDILRDYRTVLAHIYRPGAYYARVRTMARMLDRPVQDRSATADAPARRLFGIPLRDFSLLWRLLRRIATHQPVALWPFLRTFYECARHNPRAVDYVGMLAALYLHVGPFSRFVVAAIDRQIAEIDAGKWQAPPRLEPEPEPKPRQLAPAPATQLA